MICGGTIDKTYFPVREVFDFEKTHINDMIERARIPDSNLDLNIKFLFLRDSLDMEDADRSRVAKACKESTTSLILILHGTSTMVETAKKIAAEIPGGKTIVLFGALLPYELANSEALFNFGAAITAVQLLSPGVYIAMSGKVWPYNKVEKNEAEAYFMDS